MCEYCSCRTRPSIARFGNEHDDIASVASRLSLAHARDDHSAAIAIAGELVALLTPHVQREEHGLFAELDAQGAGDHTAALRDDHDALDSAFTALAAGDTTPRAWGSIPVALDRLSRHIWREEYDIFPAALQLLDRTSWDRVEAFCDAHATGAGTPALR